MALFPLPDLPSAPEFEARPSVRLRITAFVVWLLVCAGTIVVMRTGNGMAFAISMIVTTLTTLILAEIATMRVISGDDWVATRRPRSWQVVTFRDGVVASSASSGWIGGDWLFLRGPSGTVALSSAFEGAVDVMEAIHPHLRKVRMDPVTRDRLDI